MSKGQEWYARPVFCVAARPLRASAILFDADGVLQRRPAGWRDRLQHLVGPRADAGRFLLEIFEAEDAVLCGEPGFAEALDHLLRRWRCTATVSQLLDVWTELEVDPGVEKVIRTASRSGMACHLATNQEAHRASHMSVALGYRDLFDREFYSCDLGLAKPAAAYFSLVADSLRVDPRDLVFVDDRLENVESARAVGLHGIQFSLDEGAQVLSGLLSGLETPWSERHAKRSADT
jgi:putative hydrolase of the HAD superfamily